MNRRDMLFGMGAMPMVFQLRDKAILEKARVGDKVRFRAVSEKGANIVTDIQPSH